MKKWLHFTSTPPSVLMALCLSKPSLCLGARANRDNARLPLDPKAPKILFVKRKRWSNNLIYYASWFRKELDLSVLLPDYQFSFRASHSTIHQTHRIVHEITKGLEERQLCKAFFLDVAQASDKV
jgi:hypothetical protein